MRRFRRLAIVSVSASLLIGTLPTSSAEAKDYAPRVRYAKTEMEKAVGKCVATVVLGGLAGSLVGRAIDGHRGARRGTRLGLAAGAVGCAILVASAKRADRVIAAQIAAARSRDGYYSTVYRDENGVPVQMVAQARPAQTIDASRLTPVKYESDAGVFAAPVLDTGGQECRLVDGNLQSSQGSTRAPSQYICRTSSGDWSPYELSGGRT